jgi:hypothetical protein
MCTAAAAAAAAGRHGAAVKWVQQARPSAVIGVSGNIAADTAAALGVLLQL